MKNLTRLFTLTLIGSALFTFFKAVPRAGAQEGCLPPPSGMIAWWPGDGHAVDLVGDRNGITQYSAGYIFPGRVGSSFQFDGNGWVEVPDDPVWTLDSDFTIDLWVNLHRLWEREPFIAHDNFLGEEDKWIFWYDEIGHDKLPGVPALRFHINSPHPNPLPEPHDAVVAPWNPVMGQWHHVAVTRLGTTYTLYIDGTLAASDTSTYTIPDPVVPLTIGRAEFYLFQGAIDEVEIFDRALTAAEIQSIYDAGSAGKCKGLTVDIDIKPGGYPNSINLRSQGKTPVAILTKDTFDVQTVDPATIRFGANGIEAAPIHYAYEDVDRDGDTDLMMHFNTNWIGLQCGHTSAALTGLTWDGTSIHGSDSVKIVGCK